MVLWAALIAAVGHAEAVGGAAVLVVDDQGMRPVNDDDVGAAGIIAVGRGRDPDDFVPAGEDDDVLPIVLVAAREAPWNDLVLFEVVLVPGREVSPPVRDTAESWAYMTAQIPLLQREREYTLLFSNW